MVPLPEERSTAKPRKTGITMMVDFSLPVGRLEDMLGLVGPYVDLIKIAVGTARLYRELGRATLDLARRMDGSPADALTALEALLTAPED